MSSCENIVLIWVDVEFGRPLHSAICQILSDIPLQWFAVAEISLCCLASFCTATYCFLNYIAGGFPSHFLTFASLNDCQVKQQFVWPIAFWRNTKRLMWLALPQKALKGRWPITDLFVNLALATCIFIACIHRHRQRQGNFLSITTSQLHAHIHLAGSFRST